MAKEIEEADKEDRLAYGINEFCKMAGISRTGYYRLVESGDLKPFKIGGKACLDPAEVRDYIKRQKEDAAKKRAA